MKPVHYDSGEVDPLDLIAAAGYNVLEGFCRGNVIKYCFRYKEKGGAKDLNKALFYLELLRQLENYRCFAMMATGKPPVKVPPLRELKEKYGRS